jgi:hypothetical protein
MLNEAGIIKNLMSKYSLDPEYFKKPLQVKDKQGRKRLYKTYLETTWHKSFIADDEPKVLTMSDLEFGFVIWLGSCVLPLIAFIIEIIFKTVVNLRKREKVAPLSKIVEVKSSQGQIEKNKIKSGKSEQVDSNKKYDTLKIIEVLEAVKKPGEETEMNSATI